MSSAPSIAVPDHSLHPTQPQLTSLLFLAGTIDIKQAKLDQAITAAHQAQLRGQLTDLIDRFQKQYADWMNGGTGKS